MKHATVPDNFGALAPETLVAALRSLLAPSSATPATYLPLLPANDELFDTRQAAEYLGGLKAGTLEVWRSTRRYDLPFIKIGGRVRYRKSVLDAFLAARTMNTTPAEAV